MRKGHAMMQPFYCTCPDVYGEYDEYFLDHGGAYVRRERIRDRGLSITFRTDILSTHAFFRSSWPAGAKEELIIILAATDAAALDALKDREAALA